MACQDDRPVRAYLRDEATGEQVAAEYGPYPYDDDTLLYFWSEGNYACDCNRSLAFGVDDGGAECGDWRYTLWRLARGDRVLYSRRTPEEVK